MRKQHYVIMTKKCFLVISRKMLRLTIPKEFIAQVMGIMKIEESIISYVFIYQISNSVYI